MQYHLFKIIKKVYLYPLFDPAKKSKKFQCLFDPEITKCSAKISENLFDITLRSCRHRPPLTGVLSLSKILTHFGYNKDKSK